MIKKTLVSEEGLEKALKVSWCRDTSSDPDNWSLEKPAWGQCAVTSLIVNDYLGGDIVWALAKLPDGSEISHYFNKVYDEEKDFTRIQFSEGTIIPKGVPKTKQFSTTRDYIISYSATFERYKLLKEKVDKILSKK